MILTRRRALIGIVAAPFICRSTSLMRVTKALYVPPKRSLWRVSWVTMNQFGAESDDGEEITLTPGGHYGFKVGDPVEINL